MNREPLVSKCKSLTTKEKQFRFDCQLLHFCLNNTNQCYKKLCYNSIHTIICFSSEIGCPKFAIVHKGRQLMKGVSEVNVNLYKSKLNKNSIVVFDMSNLGKSKRHIKLKQVLVK